MNCPRCRNELEEVQTELGLVQMCMSCYGHASPVRFLERLITGDQWKKLLSLSTSVKGRSFKCPQCNHYHQRRRFHFPETYIDLDICQHCSLIWFVSRLLKKQPAKAKQDVLPKWPFCKKAIL